MAEPAQPLNATSEDCRRPYPEGNPYWCAAHCREHEPTPPGANNGE